ncbi:MAG: hypothetical protein JRF33_25760 [Deltaproteobacteria bacterium]|nr:hypothetical protein [Deltaproteobacteria bacterium]
MQGLGWFAWVLMYVFLSGCGIGRAELRASEDPGIREFDMPTIEKLGKAIYERDGYAALATDILLAKVGDVKALHEAKVRGWIVVEDKGHFRVRFIKQGPEGFLPAFDVDFSSPEKGVAAKAEGALTEREVSQFRARQLAIREIKQPCSKRYNTVVLPDVDGEGFIAYCLAATMKTKEVFLGGHYRITVSADGKTVERVDRLSKGCLTLPWGPNDKGQVPAVLVTNHMVSPRPIEIHVWANLVSGMDLAIFTKDGTMWQVENGKVMKTKT